VETYLALPDDTKSLIEQSNEGATKGKGKYGLKAHKQRIE
jgi:hypothetical protein